ncbi:MAG: type B 50S ribosomal protein L31 [Planctomycetota bacterium]|jgi:large subunit ribosomal protein L31
MKNKIHPEYHPVVFVDVSADYKVATRSTLKSKEVENIDGVDHYVIRVDISSASHPFYTGQERFLDAAGRIEKFRKKFGEGYGKKS